MLGVPAKLVVMSGSNSIEHCNKRDKARIYQMSRSEVDLAKQQHKQI